ncbi:NAD(P)/FAD-dependent oxidoreductase [Paenibacillus nasutitermitis]|uniref:Oxidoreductase n=1 Tax=Paenibacillus nasutitermitis TaxID=1652958 RepID=A0A917DXE9_9BACL|nr:FAD-binding oxidoreductase [Paenibacillus nasutitermitis]GGD75921.1 oxidoreductase [Paenibacillus nasutitermitis]
MKDLHNGRLYWPETLEDPHIYPSLTSNKATTVAIIGGGMSGCICGYVLAQSGIDVCIVERGDIAGGSTSANTGLLQFSNDIMLSELIEQIGEQDALLFYRACRDAVVQIGEIAARLEIDVAFIPRSSLYYASTEQDIPKLQKEYEALRSNGFDVEYWDADEIGARYPFRKPAAIITRGDAEINPYRFVRAITAAAAEQGAAIYEHTDVVTHVTTEKGKQHITTSTGHVLEAEHVIYAIGYEPEELRGQLVKANMNRTYAIATEPQHDLSPWKENMMIWETARPYFYMRTTPDGRVLAGGQDEELSEPVHSESERRKRTDKLHHRIKEHFPMFTGKLEYDWTAVFGESRDNLPFIGEDPKWPNVYYCLVYGGNGTVYSIIASQLLRNLICGEDHPIRHILRLDRPSLQNV